MEAGMKVVVVGAGRMGRRHIQAVKELNLELVGVCDTNPDSLALAEKEQGVAAGLHYKDGAEMMKSTNPELVIISTTAPTHLFYTRIATKAGAKFILCEKPMAVSLFECTEMINICKNNHIRLAINHQMRFMEQYIVPKKILDSKAMGGLCSVTGVTGNFGAAMNGSHYFEMFRFMTGEIPDSVTAWLSPNRLENPRGPQFADKAGSIRMTTPSGKRFYMDFSEDQGHGMNIIYAGRNGQVIVNELNGIMYSMIREEQYRDLPTTRYGMPAVLETIPLAPAEVIEPTKSTLAALLDGKNYPTGEEGRQVVASLVAAHISNEKGNKAIQPVISELPNKRIFPWA
jgi:predicted dehydrogenase